MFSREKILKQFAHDNQSLKNALNEFEKKFLLKIKLSIFSLITPSKIHRSRKFKTNIENISLKDVLKKYLSIT